MCGKFTQLATWPEVVAFSTPLAVPVSEANAALLTTTVMSFAHVLRLDAEGRREVVPMRWGWPDRRAADPRRAKHMHARAETIDELPTFKGAFATSRGVVVVKTFNEGEEIATASGKTRTKQWVISPRDGRPLGIAVIWEEWAHVDPETGVEERFPVFVMVTTPPNPLIARITDRMPAILRPAWLGETGVSPAEAKALLQTYPDDGWDMAPQAAGPQNKGWKPGAPPGGDQPGLF